LAYYGTSQRWTAAVFGGTADRTFIRYTAADLRERSRPGFEWIAVVQLNLQLIGVHLGRDDKNVRYGAAINAIVADLANKGFAGLLGTKLA
jgi:hypothetical protein